MGWLTNLFKKKTTSGIYAEMLNGLLPIFSQYGTDIYASDVVQQAISCIVQEMTKLRPIHIRRIGNDTVPINDSLQTVLQNPNVLMTTSDFIEKSMWLLMLNYNLFIVPIYTEGKNGTRTYSALYPIKPVQVDFLEDTQGRLAVKFRFENGYECTLNYKDIIHVRYRYSVNEYMGGNEFGQPDNKTLLKTIHLNEDLLEGVSKALKASYAINGVIKYNTMLDDAEMKTALNALEEKLKNNESGFLPMDIKGDYIPLQHRTDLVDKDTLEFVDGKILRNYGISLPILTGDYTKAQYEAFFQKTLEPIIIKIGQAFTKSLFSDREKSYGNEVQFLAEDLIFMTIEQKLEMARLLGDSGVLYDNEKRRIFGYAPIAELEGVRKQSLNYVDTKIAYKYQLKDNAKKEKTDNTGG